MEMLSSFRGDKHEFCLVVIKLKCGDRQSQFFNALSNFLRKAKSIEQTPFTKVFPSGIHFTAKSNETMWIKCLSQWHNTLMQPGIEPSIIVYRSRYFTCILISLNYEFNYCKFCVYSIIYIFKSSFA